MAVFLEARRGDRARSSYDALIAWLPQAVRRVFHWPSRWQHVAMESYSRRSFIEDIQEIHFLILLTPMVFQCSDSGILDHYCA